MIRKRNSSLFVTRRFLFFTLLVASGVFFVFSVRGATVDQITFPIPELGGCADKASCKAYCDDQAHQKECFDFAKKYGLVSEEKKPLEIPLTGGPGGCQSEEACRPYCQDPTHGEECIRFALEHDFIKKDEADRALKYLRATQETGPGGCRGANECRAYCEDPAHGEECLTFAHRQGLISEKDEEMARRVMKEGGPGECRSEAECRAYCATPTHLAECVAFGRANRIISEEEAKRAVIFVEGGPGGCKSKLECKAYCQDPSHTEECISFAEKHGFISKEEVERVKQFAQKTGPGGCRQEACKEYCEKPEHRQDCLNYALREGLISPEEVARVKKFLQISEQGGPGGCRQEACRSYCQDPSHHDECFQFAKQHGLISSEEEKRFHIGENLERKVKESGGPGGCRSGDECRSYCSDPSHVEECIAFASAHAGISLEEARRMLKEFTEHQLEIKGEFFEQQEFEGFEEHQFEKFEELRKLEHQFRGPAVFPFGSSGVLPQGPGGCKGPEECIKYCSDPSHRDECAKFNPSIGQPPPGTIFRQGEPGIESQYKDKEEELRICGPRPLFPVKEGCWGPVCKEGKWQVICPESQQPSGGTPFPSGESTGFSPQPLLTGCISDDTCKAVCFDTGNDFYTTDTCVKFRASLNTFNQSSPTVQPIGCVDEATCKIVCTDPGNPYYTSDTCVGYRAEHSEAPRMNPFSLILAPFLNIFK